MRVGLITAIVLMCALPAAADEPALTKPAPTEPTAKPVGIAARPLAVKRTVTSIARDRSGDDLLLGTSTGDVMGWRIGTGSRWLLHAAKEPIVQATTSRTGTFLAVATAKELILFLRASSAEVWRRPRPLAHGFDQFGVHMVLVSTKGVIRRLRTRDGHQVSERRAKVRREVVRAVVSPRGGLAVLGVEDG